MGQRSPSTRRRVVVASVAAALVLLVVGIGALLSLRNEAQPVDLAAATARTTPTTAAAEEDAGAGRPTAGVYRYEGTGTESLSVPPLSQDQGPTMPGTVEAVGADCWTFRIDYSTNHWQQWRYCLDGGDLLERGGESWQRWMVGPTALTNTTTVVCDPTTMAMPADAAAVDASGRCVATNGSVPGDSVSEGPTRDLGEEVIDVGGTPVTTRHLVRDHTMSGAQAGTERSEMWFAVDDGLPIRNRRSIEVRTDTVVGTTTYTETGEFRLTSLTPV